MTTSIPTAPHLKSEEAIIEGIERGLADIRSERANDSRGSKRSRSSSPTAPVAPTISTSDMKSIVSGLPHFGGPTSNQSIQF